MAGTGIPSKLANSQTQAWSLIPQFPVWLVPQQQAPRQTAPPWTAIDAGHSPNKCDHKHRNWKTADFI
jgi:hypothetical protein